MAYKDLEKKKKYQKQYFKHYKRNASQVNRKRITDRNLRLRKPNGSTADGLFHDFETHRELAINSGIQNQREWSECCKMGLMPDGIYADPQQAFGRQ